MPMMRTDDGAQIHYQVDDFREPWLPDPDEAVLLCHGFARSMKWFQQWVPVLASKYRVVRFDVRGCGEYNPLPPKGAEWSAERLARDALNLIDLLGIRRVHWAGFESGGIWGMVFAANHPDRIASLTICNTPSSAWFNQDPEKIRIANFVGTARLDAIEKIGLKQWLTETNPVRLGQLMANPMLVEWHTKEQSKTPTEVAVAILRALNAADLCGLAGKVRVPVLILNGDRSRQCALDQQYELQRAFPDARMAVFPNIADGLQLQIAARCAEEVLKLVESL